MTGGTHAVSDADVRADLARALAVLPRPAPVLREQAPRLKRADIVRLISQECEQAGGQSAWARRHGVSISQLSEVINSRRAPNAKMLLALGYQPLPVEYVRVRGGKP